MDVVRVLPAEVVDQIAAGEVVERPASVVKELVDNALDAGAKAIVIETAAGGRALVRVTDDGCGMSPADATRALLPHATSKLRDVDDLWSLVTMGFRGEALPSIASVSKMVLTTRREGDLAATRVTVLAGRVESVEEVGAAVGTTVEITELFGNVPARLKFLKGEGTEASHVTELVVKIAMAHPALHVRLKHNGRTALELPPDRDGFARAQALLGAKVAARMVPVTGEDGGVRVAAYLAAPELAQTTARGVQLFVGRRPVRDRGLLHAVAMGYGELVPRGRYPVAVVLVDVPAGAVDVNVHPQKVEVRFADANAVAAAVRHVVQRGVARAPWREEVGGVMMTAIASVAPPALPWDGESATPLARRYAAGLAAGMNAGQRSLGFDSGGGGGGARAWVKDVKSGVRAGRAAEDGEVGGRYARSRPAAGSYGEADGERRAGDGFGDRGAADGYGDRRTGDGYGDPRTADGYGGRRAADGFGGRQAADGYGERETAAGNGYGERQTAAGNGYGERETAAGNGYGKRETAAGNGYGKRETANGYGERQTADGDGERQTADGDGERQTADGYGERPTANGHGERPTANGYGEPPSAASHAHGSGPTPAPGYFSSLRYMGQLDLTYLLCEGDGELVLVDQHVAHERAELARLAASGAASDVPTQKLLFPTTFEAPDAQLALLSRTAAVLAQIGFEAEPFGARAIALKSVPAGLRHGDPVQLLRALLLDWEDRGAPTEADLLAHARSQIACHSVVRAGDRLEPHEAEALLRDLDSLDPRTPNPHGRPVLLRLPLSEIARRFGR